MERIAARADKVREARRDGPLAPTAYTRGAGRWQVSFFRDKREVVQVSVDDRSGAILEQWSGHQVAWRMARGYSGAFGRKLNAPYVWIPLCLLFLLPFVDFRRPLRLLHLDLLVMLGFGASHVFFNRGEIGLSVAARLPGADLPAGPHAVRRSAAAEEPGPARAARAARVARGRAGRAGRFSAWR